MMTMVVAAILSLQATRWPAVATEQLCNLWRCSRLGLTRMAFSARTFSANVFSARTFSVRVLRAIAGRPLRALHDLCNDAKAHKAHLAVDDFSPGTTMGGLAMSATITRPAAQGNPTQHGLLRARGTSLAKCNGSVVFARDPLAARKTRATVQRSSAAAMRWACSLGCIGCMLAASCRRSDAQAGRGQRQVLAYTMQKPHA
jgi:hypothetical protein